DRRVSAANVDILMLLDELKTILYKWYQSHLENFCLRRNLFCTCIYFIFSIFMDSLSPQEVILNGDSPVPTRIVEGVVQPVAPTTAEQKLARKNELKARGTLLMALPDKLQLKFNSHKDA
nr:hypothetical protein [Tanacetum cinerariifolium]